MRYKSTGNVRRILYVAFNILIVTILSCKSTSIPDVLLRSELPDRVLVGSIGTFKRGVLNNRFNEVGTPELKNQVKLNISKEYISNSDYKKLLRAQERETDSFGINDSIHNHFSLKLSLADEIEYIRSINASENLKQYLINTNEGVIISEISTFFPEHLATRLMSAEEIYLENNSKSAYSLLLYSKELGYERLSFKDGILLDYKVSKICWIKNYRNDIEVSALIKKGSSCPGKTKQKPNKLQREKNFDEYY